MRQLYIAAFILYAISIAATVAWARNTESKQTAAILYDAAARSQAVGRYIEAGILYERANVEYPSTVAIILSARAYWRAGDRENGSRMAIKAVLALLPSELNVLSALDRKDFIPPVHITTGDF